MTQPSCIITHPKPVPDASQNTSKGFSISGCAKIGAEVNKVRKVSKAASHSKVHTNFSSFLKKSCHWIGNFGEVQNEPMVVTC